MDKTKLNCIFEKSKDFIPDLFYCGECGEVIFSPTEGAFVRCGCGESFIDQTSHYYRSGGKCKALTNDSN